MISQSAVIGFNPHYKLLFD